jgi:ribosomal protein L37E
MEEPRRSRRSDRHITPPQETEYNDSYYEPEPIPPRRPPNTALASRTGYHEEPPRQVSPYDNRRPQYPQAYDAPPPPAQYQQPPQYQPPAEPARVIMETRANSNVKCKRCGSTNVQMQREQIGSKTGIKGRGCLASIGRTLLIICTAGLWLLVTKKRGTAKTKNKFRTLALCQDCGKSWYV